MNKYDYVQVDPKVIAALGGDELDALEGVSYRTDPNSKIPQSRRSMKETYSYNSDLAGDLPDEEMNDSSYYTPLSTNTLDEAPSTSIEESLRQIAKELHEIKMILAGND